MTDGFNLKHQPDCPRPEWRISNRRTNGRPEQFCRNCGIRWAHPAAETNNSINDQENQK